MRLSAVALALYAVISAASQDTFEFRAPILGPAQATSVKVLAQGRSGPGPDFVTAGYFTTSQTRAGLPSLMVHRFSCDGRVIWSQTLVGYRVEKDGCIGETPEGDLLIAASSETREGKQGELVFLSGADGAINFIHQQVMPKGFVYTGIAIPRDGNPLLSGYYGDNRLNPIVMRLRRQLKPSRDMGNVWDFRNKIWAYSYGKQTDVVQSLMSTDSADAWVMAGTRHGTRAFAMKINGQGGVYWEKEFTQYRSTFAHQIKEVTKGEYLVVGRATEGDDSQTRGWAAKLSDVREDRRHVNLDWERAYGAETDDHAEFVGVAAGETGFLFTGTDNFLDRQGAPFLVRTTAEGVPRLVLSPRAQAGSEILGIRALKGNQYVFSGKARVPNFPRFQTEYWILKGPWDELIRRLSPD